MIYYLFIIVCLIVNIIFHKVRDACDFCYVRACKACWQNGLRSDLSRVDIGQARIARRCSCWRKWRRKWRRTRWRANFKILRLVIRSVSDFIRHKIWVGIRIQVSFPEIEEKEKFTNAESVYKVYEYLGLMQDIQIYSYLMRIFL